MTTRVVRYLPQDTETRIRVNSTEPTMVTFARGDGFSPSTGPHLPSAKWVHPPEIMLEASLGCNHPDEAAERVTLWLRDRLRGVIQEVIEDYQRHGTGPPGWLIMLVRKVPTITVINKRFTVAELPDDSAHKRIRMTGMHAYARVAVAAFSCPDNAHIAKGPQFGFEIPSPVEINPLPDWDDTLLVPMVETWFTDLTRMWLDPRTVPASSAMRLKLDERTARGLLEEGRILRRQHERHAAPVRQLTDSDLKTRSR